LYAQQPTPADHTKVNTRDKKPSAHCDQPKKENRRTSRPTRPPPRSGRRWCDNRFDGCPNVKVTPRTATVTLKGPVRSERTRRKCVEAKAIEVAGAPNARPDLGGAREVEDQEQDRAESLTVCRHVSSFTIHAAPTRLAPDWSNQGPVQVDVARASATVRAERRVCSPLRARQHTMAQSQTSNGFVIRREIGVERRFRSRFFARRPYHKCVEAVIDSRIIPEAPLPRGMSYSHPGRADDRHRRHHIESAQDSASHQVPQNV